MQPQDLLAVAPPESAIVVLTALAIAIGVSWLLVTFASKHVPKSKSETSVKILGFEFSLKAGGVLVMFMLIFVLLVVFYVLLRITPGIP